MADDDALDALRKHNEQLEQLFSSDGRAQLDRLVLLELSVHAYVNGRLSEYKSLHDRNEDQFRGRIADRLQTELQGLDEEDANRLAADIATFLEVPDSVKNVGKKIGSVANSYLKKKAGGILGGADDNDTED
ncbi:MULTISPECIES: hypothetical protein [Cereibacter]|uniref:Uncharacterized protein n=1 Tax=Cereibacter azotoformans TaxID=43057 RepID=A0A2T5JT89_9RHOB|nr:MULTISPECIES: hypothetical protein [Cereibacter]PTR13390.1 hypothetical protein C8J28_12220 [Cereibacter azotoformans]